MATVKGPAGMKGELWNAYVCSFPLCPAQVCLPPAGVASRMCKAWRRAFPTGRWASMRMVTSLCAARRVRGSPRDPVVWADAAQLASWVRDGMGTPLVDQGHWRRWRLAQNWALGHLDAGPWKTQDKAILEAQECRTVPTAAFYNALMHDSYGSAAPGHWHLRGAARRWWTTRGEETGLVQGATLTQAFHMLEVLFGGVLEVPVKAEAGQGCAPASLRMRGSRHQMGMDFSGSWYARRGLVWSLCRRHLGQE